MHKKYEYWEVCQDHDETDDILCMGSIWSDEWRGINEEFKIMTDSEIRQMLTEEIESYEVANKEKIDKRKISSALKEFKDIMKEFKIA